MDLFYTVVSQEGAAQSKALNSLGGFCSSSKVANANLDAVFGEVSTYALQNPKPEYIGLILKNTLGRSVKNVKFWCVNPTSAMCKIRISVVELSDNGEMETIPSVNSMPLYADFVNATENDPIVLSSEVSFLSGQMVGIWLERSVNANSEAVIRRNDCDWLFNNFNNNVSLETEETLQLKISFDYAN